MDNVREDLEERDIQLSTAHGKTKNRSLEKYKKGLIVSKLMEEKTEEEERTRDQFHYVIQKLVQPH